MTTPHFSIDPSTGQPSRIRNFHQRLATSLNWYLFMLLGAKSTVCGNFLHYIVTQREHNHSLSTPQRLAMNEIRARAAEIERLMNVQEEAVRGFQYLPKLDLTNSK